MEYDVHLQEENKIVLCICKGELDLSSKNTARSMIREVRKKAFECGYNTLYDVIKTSLSVTLADAFFFSRDGENFYEDNAHRSAKAAIVYETDKDYWEFSETTSQNAGINIRVFCDKKDALGWLSKE